MGKFTNEPRLHSAADETGTNTKFQVRINPSWVRQMDIVVKSHKFPYVSRGELARDALFRHFEWLETFAMPNDSILQKIESMVDLLEEAKIQQGFEKVVTGLEERVAYFNQKSARNEAVRCVLRILGYVDEMADGYWKDQFRKEIKSKYVGLLNCIPKAQLAALNGEDDGAEHATPPLNADISEEDIG